MEIEVDTVNITVLNQLKIILNQRNLPIRIHNIDITDINITTVCTLNSTTYQCRCEDQYLWPCNKCLNYGSCDDIINTPCSCINALPDDGPFCVPMTELNAFICPPIITTTDATTASVTITEVKTLPVTTAKGASTSVVTTSDTTTDSTTPTFTTTEGQTKKGIVSTTRWSIATITNTDFSTSSITTANDTATVQTTNPTTTDLPTQIPTTTELSTTVVPTLEITKTSVKTPDTTTPAVTTTPLTTTEKTNETLSTTEKNTETTTKTSIAIETPKTILTTTKHPTTTNPPTTTDTSKTTGTTTNPLPTTETSTTEPPTTKPPTTTETPTTEPPTTTETSTTKTTTKPLPTTETSTTKPPTTELPTTTKTSTTETTTKPLPTTETSTTETPTTKPPTSTDTPTAEPPTTTTETSTTETTTKLLPTTETSTTEPLPTTETSTTETPTNKHPTSTETPTTEPPATTGTTMTTETPTTAPLTTTEPPTTEPPTTSETSMTNATPTTESTTTTNKTPTTAPPTTTETSTTEPPTTTETSTTKTTTNPLPTTETPTTEPPITKPPTTTETPTTEPPTTTETTTTTKTSTTAPPTTTDTSKTTGTSTKTLPTTETSTTEPPTTEPPTTTETSTTETTTKPLPTTETSATEPHTTKPHTSTETTMTTATLTTAPPTTTETPTTEPPTTNKTSITETSTKPLPTTETSTTEPPTTKPPTTTETPTTVTITKPLPTTETSTTEPPTTKPPTTIETPTTKPPTTTETSTTKTTTNPLTTTETPTTEPPTTTETTTTTKIPTTEPPTTTETFTTKTTTTPLPTTETPTTEPPTITETTMTTETPTTNPLITIPPTTTKTPTTESPTITETTMSTATPTSEPPTTIEITTTTKTPTTAPPTTIETPMTTGTPTTSRITTTENVFTTITTTTVKTTENTTRKTTSIPIRSVTITTPLLTPSTTVTKKSVIPTTVILFTASTTTATEPTSTTTTSSTTQATTPLVSTTATVEPSSVTTTAETSAILVTLTTTQLPTTNGPSLTTSTPTAATTTTPAVYTTNSTRYNTTTLTLTAAPIPTTTTSNTITTNASPNTTLTTMATPPYTLTTLAIPTTIPNTRATPSTTSATMSTSTITPTTILTSGTNHIVNVTLTTTNPTAKATPTATPTTSITTTKAEITTIPTTQAKTTTTTSTTTQAETTTVPTTKAKTTTTPTTKAETTTTTSTTTQAETTTIPTTKAKTTTTTSTTMQAETTTIPTTKAKITTIPTTRAETTSTTSTTTQAETTTIPITEAKITTIPTTKSKTTTTPTTNAKTTTTPTTKAKTITTPTTKATTTIAVMRSINYSMTLTETFDFQLTNKNSDKFKKYKKSIQDWIEISYKNVAGYVAGSAVVTGFRPGSVIVDYSINTNTNTSPNLTTANQLLVQYLVSGGFNVTANAFSRSVEGGMISTDIKYPEENLTFTCNSTNSMNISWKRNGQELSDPKRYIIKGPNLTVINVTFDDSGEYVCSSMVDSLPFLNRQTVTVLSYPEIQVTSDMTVECVDKTEVSLKCCVQSSYTVKWDSSLCSSTAQDASGCISCNYEINATQCQKNDETIKIPCITTVLNFKKNITITTVNKKFNCSDAVYGAGNEGDILNANCNGDMVGNQVVQCESGVWTVKINNCSLRVIQNLVTQAVNLQIVDLPQFVSNLKSATSSYASNVTNSSANILNSISLLKTIATVSQTVIVDQTIMTGFLETVSIVGSQEAQSTWNTLNTNDTQNNPSSELLSSVEKMGQRLSNDSVNISQPTFQLEKITNFTSFSGAFGENSSTSISISEFSKDTFITIIVISGLNKILPVRTSTCNNCSKSGTAINGDVVVVQTVPKINNISLSYAPQNTSLGNPQCVFWNFSILNNTGGWDSAGCRVIKQDGNIICECDHTTSFSVLMSPTTKTNTTTTPSTKTDTTTTPATKTNTTTTPATKTTTTTTPATKTTTTTTPTAVTRLIDYSMTLTEDFDFQLNDKNSDKFKKYQKTIKDRIELSYKNVAGYVAGSAVVTGFRPGSVIVDYSIKTNTDTSPNLKTANEQLVQDLKSDGFNVTADAFSRTIEGGMISPDIKYPGQDLTFTCNSTNSTISWKKDGKELSEPKRYIIKDLSLTVIKAISSDSGEYVCSSMVDSLPFLNRQTVTVLSYPEIQVTSDMTVQCVDKAEVSLKCCVQSRYTVKWDSPLCSSTAPDASGCISCTYKIIATKCQKYDETIKIPCITTPLDLKKEITITAKNKTFSCSDAVYGAGNEGDILNANCNGDMVGNQVVQCETRVWTVKINNCSLRVIQNLVTQAVNLKIDDLPQFVSYLSNVTADYASNVANSSATILNIVTLLKAIATVSQKIIVDQAMMTGFLETVSIIGSQDAQSTWNTLNTNDTQNNPSSELLSSVEKMAQRLSNDAMNISTPTFQLEKITNSTSFSGAFGENSSTLIDISKFSKDTFITIIVVSGLNKILPVRTSTCNNCSESGTAINGDVVVVQTVPKINNISLSYVPKNMSLGEPQCVFWNFSILNNTGGWDSAGCNVKKKDGNITCECDHTTSFSVLMSPFTLSAFQLLILDYITYIGVGISMGSLVLCLIIEMIIWKSVTKNETSYMRHVSIVNIAVSLLIADCCFIVGAAVVYNQNVNLCIAATFFSHLFYLALFFWMLLSALLLLYRTVMVFSRLSRRKLMAVAFSVGYGAPLLIAVITVACTAGPKHYIQTGYNCWLNWIQTKALLAFVIPALTIVVINFVVLVLVMCKMLRRGVGASAPSDEKHALMVIAKCVALLTPLFGLTWGFGIGTMVSADFAIHVVFSFLNSLQGFFILMFGTLLDSKVREALGKRFTLGKLSSSRTRTTTAGPSLSSSRSRPRRNIFPRINRRNVYHVMEAERSWTTSTETYTSINT